MTKKQFSYNVNKNTIQYDGKFVAYMNCVDGFRIANKLNVFQKEKEQLEKENLDLLEELDYYKTKCASLETGLFQADRKNGQLQKENKELQGKASSWKITASEQIMEQSKLIKENEKLKQQIKDLRIKVLDRKDKSCGHCKHFQVDGMFGMWCEKKHNWTEVKYCEDYER